MDHIQQLLHVGGLSTAVNPAAVVQLCCPNHQIIDELIGDSEKEMKLINDHMIKFNLKQWRVDGAKSLGWIGTGRQTGTAFQLSQ